MAEETHPWVQRPKETARAYAAFRAYMTMGTSRTIAKAAVAEGKKTSEWLLLDYFNFVVHVFSPDCRAYYGLERLWGSAERHEFAESRPSSR